MLAQALNGTGIVFSKTDKGREEMTKRSFGLNPLQRRVLILVDGIKDLETLAEMHPAMAPAGQFGEILEHLLEHGFITSADNHTASRFNPNTPAFSDQADPDIAQVAAETLIGAAAMPVVTTVADTTTMPTGGGVSLTKDPETIRQVKDFMTTTAQTYLGLLSAPVIQRIEQARTAAQLMTVAGHWNMALRDSQQGKRFAGPYLEQVKSALLMSAHPFPVETGAAS